MLHLTFQPAVQPGYGEAWPAWGKRPPRESLSMIEPKKVVEKRALNTTAACSRRRPARTAAGALRDNHEGEENKSHPGMYILIYSLFASHLCAT